MCAKMECKVVTEFNAKMVEAFEQLKDGIPSVNISKLMPAALEHFQHVQYLDQLQSMALEDPANLMWSCAAILNHKFRTLDPLDHHVKVKLLWKNGE